MRITVIATICLSNFNFKTRRIRGLFKLGLVWGRMLTQVLYRERILSFHISTKTPSAHFSSIEALKHVVQLG